MTRYRVIITPEAEKEILATFDYIADRDPTYAEKWIRELYRRMDTLEALPRSRGYAREQRFFKKEMRQLIHKSHRIIFTIDDETNTVYVISVRHAKRRTLGEPEQD